MWSAMLGCALLLLSAIPGVYLLRTHGKARKKTQHEVVGRILNYDIADQPSYAAGSGSGVRVEASATMDTLRKAAARGDWALFWCWPLAFFCFCIGAQLLFTALSLRSHELMPALVTGIALVPMGLFGFFMAWAAIYTDIDRSDDVAALPDSGDIAAPQSNEHR
jgi:hypothetical protein